MSTTVTVRLPEDLVAWLDEVSRTSGLPRGRIIRDQLEQARKQGAQPAFMHLAGSLNLAPDLSTRKGFSRS
jgi:predicted transcriptional regulator